MHRFLVWFAVVALVVSALPASARFERYVNEGCADESVCYYWRPKLAAFPGWHLDEEASKLPRANVLVPDGSTYENAKVVIYVRATAMEDVAGKTIAEFMAQDRDEATMMWPGTIFADAPALKNGFGRKLKSQTFTPVASAENRWQRSAYDKQGRFFITFTLSAVSQAGLDAGMKDFARLVAAYKVKP
jgi:hypothetical protein